ncbi:MAG: hypothetical protein K8S99_16350 [Planctomycetes bacterium]|nr:hypothetical protein [Planctomycetota bacterium]
MTTDRINYLNIGLMVASAAAAFVVPFELFLFAYAVLGPLHYFTEISWLHDRKYFCNRRWDWVPIAALAVLLLLGTDIVMGPYQVKALEDLGGDLILFAFGLSLILVTLKSVKARLAAAMGLLLLTLFLHDPAQSLDNIWLLIFLVFVPTLIHVFVFTGAFILLGALRSRSVSGYVSLAVFLLCAASFLVVRPDASDYVVSGYVRESYAYFAAVNRVVLNMLHVSPISGRDFFAQPANLVLMRFIGFAYVYHYLNWFSKTSIIRWHEVSRLRMAAVAVLWLASVGVYAWDYALGVKWLLFLSMAHVLLEFPLNHRSFIGIGQELWWRVCGRAAVGA